VLRALQSEQQSPSADEIAVVGAVMHSLPLHEQRSVGSDDVVTLPACMAACTLIFRNGFATGLSAEAIKTISKLMGMAYTAMERSVTGGSSTTLEVFSMSAAVGALYAVICMEYNEKLPPAERAPMMKAVMENSPSFIGVIQSMTHESAAACLATPLSVKLFQHPDLVLACGMAIQCFWFTSLKKDAIGQPPKICVVLPDGTLPVLIHRNLL
jgi:hypothetical protein